VFKEGFLTLGYRKKKDACGKDRIGGCTTDGRFGGKGGGNHLCSQHLPCEASEELTIK